MKRLIVFFMLLAFTIPAIAADVTLQVVIKDKYVARLQEAVQANSILLNCGTLNAKQCLERKIFKDIRSLVFNYEKQRDMKIAADLVISIEEE